MNQFWLALITGLTTGGLSCFAVQGGLLTSALAQEGIGNQPGKQNIKYLKEKSILMFLAAKLIAYTLLGFLLGALGSVIVISIKFQAFLQILVGFYMLATAARLLNLHPVFKYFVIQPPTSLLKLVRKSSQVKSFFAPALLGFLTILIPCGVTQAMMLLAIASGGAIWGAGIMFFFVLGTSPVFFLIGLAATELLKNKSFAIVAAIFITILGITSINSGQIIRGSAHTLQNYWKVISGSDIIQGSASIKDGKQEVTIEVTSRGYKSNTNTLKLGVPVKLTLITNNIFSCARAFVIPSLDYSKVLPQTGKTVVEFTPKTLGQLTYTCSMGMYSGSFNVVE
ncbi:MAG: sulfite exporter TauE/SafE family protein [Candidatus Woesebacteria bacterium]|nr:MAG: sulfite exporter TauE/SafE family protein [Candidatus Woesebacteria bacterium]